MQQVNKAYIKQVSKEEFLICTQLLPKIKREFGNVFSRLILPEVVFECIHQSNVYTVLFKYYNGKYYNEIWNEEDGGSLLGLELVNEMINIIEDLLNIDIEYLYQTEEVKQINGFVFNYQDWLKSYTIRFDKAIQVGISTEELEKAKDFLEDGFSRKKLIFSNGDFYPRNLIKVNNGQQLVLIDWEYWGENFRVNYVDHLENIIAFAYIHMWGNVNWQNEFLKSAINNFNLRLDDLRKSIMIKSFEQAILWLDYPQFSNFQTEHFRRALSNQLI